jgi:hypothetical protein
MTRKMKRRMRRKSKRPGSAAWLTLAVLAGMLLPATGAEPSAQPESKLRQYALIAGTVFTDTGLALRGAGVQLIPGPQESRKHKTRKLEAVSDSRGEFAFRVPAAAGRYTVRVRRDGFEPQEKTVTITGDERVDVSFQLVPRKM